MAFRSSSGKSRQVKGNPTTTPAALEYRKQKQKVKERPFEQDRLTRTFSDSVLVGALFYYEATEYIRAYYDRAERKVLWQGLCNKINLVPPELAFKKSFSSTSDLFNNMAAVVLEECLHSVTIALADRWLDKKTVPWLDNAVTGSTLRSAGTQIEVFSSPQHDCHNKHQFKYPNIIGENKATCTPMKMEPIRRTLNDQSMIVYFEFELSKHCSGFTKQQLDYIRPGTIVECLPGDKTAVGDVVLGAICNTNRSAAEKSRSFSVMTGTQHFVRPMEYTQWSIQPLTSLVSEMRQLESCQRIRMGEVQVPFLELLKGQKLNVEMLSLPQYPSSSPSRSSLTSVINLANADARRNFDLPKLNEKQAKAATEFLDSKTGSISLVRGPPGTGKTTFLVATICEYLLRSLPEDQNQRCKSKQTATNDGTPSLLMVAAPSNKAVSVLATRFMQAILEEDGRGRTVRVVLLGDEGKLMEDILHSPQKKLKGKAACARASISSIFAYKFLPNLESSLRSVEQLFKDRTSIITIPSNHGVFRLLAQFIDIGCVFKAGMRSCAQKLRAALSNMADATSSQQDNRVVLKLLKSVRKYAKSCGRDGETAHKVTCALVRKADVIFCTLAASGSNVFKSRMKPFKIQDLIVDEGAACTEPELAIPFHLGPNRLLVVGDPMQLPAAVKSPVAKQFGLDKSLLERLMLQNYPSTMLEKQYRMRCEIAEFPSKKFYQGLLQNSEKVMSSSYNNPVPLLGPSQGPFFFQEVIGKEEKKENGSYQNVVEAKAVFQWIRKLKAKAAATDPYWFRSDKIRIIAFYQAQVDLINTMLGALGFGFARSGLTATTVDSSQGCESNVVIVSFVRTCHSQAGTARGVAGFLTEDQRINVALTRAKYELVCVGSAGNMLGNPMVTTLQAFASAAQSNGCIGRGDACEVIGNKKIKGKKRKRKENKVLHAKRHKN